MKLLPKPDVFNPACPSRELLHTVANKWTMLVIDCIGVESVRNSELMRRVRGISQKMLSQTLSELAELGLIDRKDFQTVPPHVEYTLTPAGLSMQREVCALNRWIEAHITVRLRLQRQAQRRKELAAV